MQINGNMQDELINNSIHIDNISKGGFRFTSDIDLELEDRVQVILKFPDDSAKEVLGRICYCDSNGFEDGPDQIRAYGFSVLEGFYDLARNTKR